jgi:hypothetical protein
MLNLYLFRVFYTRTNKTKLLFVTCLLYKKIINKTLGSRLNNNIPFYNLLKRFVRIFSQKKFKIISTRVDCGLYI